jgi:hypothetical protein
MHICSAYCAIRDRDVYVALTDELAPEDETELRDLEIICMKYSYAPICDGDFCPNFGTDRVAVGIRPAGCATT